MLSIIYNYIISIPFYFTYFKPSTISIGKSGNAVVNFGCWSNKLDFLNNCHYGLAQRIIEFADEAGSDPYQRHFNAEALVDFALVEHVDDRSIDYIYRKFVYSKLVAENPAFDEQEAEIADITGEFKKII